MLLSFLSILQTSVVGVSNRYAAEAKKMRNKKKKVLLLSPRDPNVQGGATFFDPNAVARANQRMRVKEKEDLEAEATKKTKKQIKFNNKLLKAKEQADTWKKSTCRHTRLIITLLSGASRCWKAG